MLKFSTQIILLVLVLAYADKFWTRKKRGNGKKEKRQTERGKWEKKKETTRKKQSKGKRSQTYRHKLVRIDEIKRAKRLL